MKNTQQLREDLARLQDEIDGFPLAETQNILAAEISSKKEKQLAHAVLWLFQNSVLKPEREWKPVENSPEKTRGDW